MFFFQIKTKRKLFFVRFQIIVLLNLCYRSYKRIISFFVWTHSLNWHHFSYFPIIALTEEKYECLGTWTMQRLNGYEFKHQHHFQSFSTFHHLTEHNQDIFLFHHKYEICFSHYDFNLNLSVFIIFVSCWTNLAEFDIISSCRRKNMV